MDEKIIINDQISGVHIGDFPVYQKADNIIDSQIFGIPLKFIALFGIALYLFKKRKKR